MNDVFGRDQLEQVTHNLRCSGLIVPIDETLQAFADRPLSEHKYPVALTDLGGWLVGKGFLTPWQFRMLCQGKSKGFFVDGYKLLDHLDGKPGDGHYLAERIETGRRVVMLFIGSVPPNTAPSTHQIVHEFR